LSDRQSVHLDGFIADFLRGALWCAGNTDWIWVLILILRHKLNRSIVVALKAKVKEAIIIENIIPLQGGAQLLGMRPRASILLTLHLGWRQWRRRRRLAALEMPRVTVTAVVILTVVANSIVISISEE